MTLLAQISESSQDKLVQAIQDASARSPELYLVLAFTVVVLFMIGLGLRFVIKFIEDHAKRSEERDRIQAATSLQKMVKIQEMGDACHLSQRENTAATVVMLNKFGDRLDEHTLAIRSMMERNGRD